MKVTHFKAEGRRQTAEGFKTFCYPSVGLVTKTGDRLRLSGDADVLKSKQSFNCGNFFFLLPSAFCPLPSAFPQPRSPKVAKNQDILQTYDSSLKNLKFSYSK
ncbi:MAG: hypothetical protein RM368_26410 [Nostoc sp. DedSLP03]|nr:hypothetical protein [Nostoc sp. DedSLP03]